MALSDYLGTKTIIPQTDINHSVGTTLKSAVFAKTH